MQEVFLKRLYRAPHFDSPEHEKRWLYRVALNQCKDEWKRRHRRDLPLEAAALVAVPPEQRELLEQVAALPEKMRTVIHLHYYEGYTVREIATILRKPVGTVATCLARGRQRLKQQMEGDFL